MDKLLGKKKDMIIKLVRLSATNLMIYELFYFSQHKVKISGSPEWLHKEDIKRELEKRDMLCRKLITGFRYIFIS